MTDVKIDVSRLSIERGLFGGWVLKAHPTTPDVMGERLLRAYSDLDALLAGLDQLLRQQEG